MSRNTSGKKKGIEFEKRIARLLTWLNSPGSRVKHDVKIPDPEDPSASRQIDIVIERDGLLTHVECRDRVRAQDVEWIENLIGRRQSLGASLVIAVSSSGFTGLAKKKAEKHGILLRFLDEIGVEEANTWGRTCTLHYSLIRFHAISLILQSKMRLAKKEAHASWFWLVKQNNLAEHLSLACRSLIPNLIEHRATPFEVPLIWTKGLPIPLALNGVESVSLSGVAERVDVEQLLSSASIWCDPVANQTTNILETPLGASGFFSNRGNATLVVDATQVVVPFNHGLLSDFSVSPLPARVDCVRVFCEFAFRSAITNFGLSNRVHRS